MSVAERRAVTSFQNARWERSLRGSYAWPLKQLALEVSYTSAVKHSGESQTRDMKTALCLDLPSLPWPPVASSREWLQRQDFFEFESESVTRASFCRRSQRRPFAAFTSSRPHPAAFLFALSSFIMHLSLEQAG